MQFLNKNKIKFLISNLPEKPGVYQFFDKENKILYVGKAKNLKKRVSSYFKKEHYENNKIRVLVNKINEIKYIVVNSEPDALLLENNLIKEYKPKYNIQLKDDKTFPWVCIKNENFPRIIITRKHIDDGSIYFGPFTSVVVVKTILEFIKQLYPLRNCNYDLDFKKIQKNKYKPCLEYYIGNCKAPCIGLQTNEEYLNNIQQIKEILRGNIIVVKNILKDLMLQYAENHKYENAQKIKEKINILDKFQSKSNIVNESINNVDVFSIMSDKEYGYINYLKIVNGAIVNVHSVKIVKKLDETENDLLLFAIIDIRNKLQSNSPEIILPFMPDLKIPGVKIVVPKSGDKLKLFEISKRNVKFFMIQQRSSEGNTVIKNSIIKNLERVKNDLRLVVLPKHIECFDNSNLHGINAVASCVVFRDLRPSKKEYRHFNIKTVEGPDDYGSMEEIIYRRYKRMFDDNSSLPQLIVIDGGKGQLNAAIKSLEKLHINNKISVISIAKKLEEIYFPNDPIPLYLDKQSETLRIIQHLRNEAHRFGIKFHRKKRTNSLITSELDNMKGIGEKTKLLLINQFKTISNLKQQNIKALEKIVGVTKAKKILEHFHKN
jgi:excinuclease ABC subunit C